MALVEKTGNGASAMTSDMAARSADIVFLAIPWEPMEQVIKSLGDMEGKTIIDLSWPENELADDGFYRMTVEPSGAEVIQGWIPKAMVVKAFGTTGTNVIDDPNDAGGLVTIPIASDHKDAKERVARLAEEMGLDPVDFGPLRMARYVELLGNIYMIPLLQHRSSEWEFQFQRNADWACRFNEDWSDPVYDSGGLASMPNRSEQQPECQ